MEDSKNQAREKEVDVMSTAVKLRVAEVAYINEMDSFLDRLLQQQKESREDSIRDAKEALHRTGVATKAGKPKKKIVSWE